MLHHKRPPPSYHWEGFGRKNTKPPWFDVRKFDKDRRDVGWVVKGMGQSPPGLKNLRKEAAPFVHDNDERIYKPTVPRKRGDWVEVPASPTSRAFLSRAGGGRGKLSPETGIEAKTAAMREETRHSRLQMLANVEVARRSELRETICGRAESIKKPLLYPNTVTHQQALNLEKKTGPRPFIVEEDELKDLRGSATTMPFERWNQHMYLPYARTRSDFPGLSSSIFPDSSC